MAYDPKEDGLRAEIERLRREGDQQRAEIERLRAALKPFAEVPPSANPDMRCIVMDAGSGAFRYYGANATSLAAPPRPPVTLRGRQC